MPRKKNQNGRRVAMHPNTKHRDDLTFFRTPDGYRARDSNRVELIDNGANAKFESRVTQAREEDRIIGGIDSAERCNFVNLTSNVGADKIGAWLACAQVVVQLAFPLWLLGLQARASGGVPVPIDDTAQMLAEQYFNKSDPLPCVETTKWCIKEVLTDMEKHDIIVCFFVDDISVFKVNEDLAVPVAKVVCRRKSNGSKIAKLIAKSKSELREIIADLVKFHE